MSNVVVTGFMGTGKTAVGREVARQLGRPFVDMDAEIEARARKSISRIFAEDGEAVFRQMETALCAELSTQQGLVIATGGGTLVDSANRVRMMKSGTVICLSCDADDILDRVSRDQDRPLLDVADPHAEIERLLEARREAYTAIGWQIGTTGLSIEEIAARVIEIVGIITLPVRHPNGQYEIQIGSGVLARVGDVLRTAGVPRDSHVAIVSNPVVEPLYGAQVEDSLRSAGYRSVVCLMPDGEPRKTLSAVSALYDQFLASGLDRSDTVLSLGGGVTGDVAGFAAATFMRGVRFVQVPTTLLAMVDASVGGKVGVNLSKGKNLVGSFKQPALVVIDPAALATLSTEEIRSGLAEVIKHGMIGDPILFEELMVGEGMLSSWWGKGGAAWIARALRVKIDVVEEDPYEQGRRAVLNLGHTVGHALEQLSGFSLRHGEAVSIGMVAAVRIATALGRADPALPDRVEAVLKVWGLPVKCPPFEPDAIWEAMAYDKKRRGRALQWILPRAVGDVEIAEDIPPDVVKSVLHHMALGNGDD